MAIRRCHLGGVLGVEAFETTDAGCVRLIGWLRSNGTVEFVGVEGTGSYGAGLPRQLDRAEITVVEVDRPNRQVRHRVGKSDPVDAVSSARAALSGRPLGVPKCIVVPGRVKVLWWANRLSPSMMEQVGRMTARRVTAAMQAPERLVHRSSASPTAGVGPSMRQRLTTDSVERLIDAPPQHLYDIVADVARTPELSPDIVRCEWTVGHRQATVGARCKATNKFGLWPRVSNRPTVITADPGREFAFSRTAPFAGTLEWRYRFLPDGSGTRVVESYTVTRQVSLVGWFMLGTLKGSKDRQSEMRTSMTTTLRRLAALAEPGTPANPSR